MKREDSIRNSLQKAWETAKSSREEEIEDFENKITNILEQVIIFKKDVREKYETMYKAEAEQFEKSLANIPYPESYEIDPLLKSYSANTEPKFIIHPANKLLGEVLSQIEINELTIPKLIKYGSQQQENWHWDP